jgi:hypothetical protein
LVAVEGLKLLGHLENDREEFYVSSISEVGSRQSQDRGVEDSISVAVLQVVGNHSVESDLHSLVRDFVLHSGVEVIKLDVTLVRRV